MHSFLASCLLSTEYAILISFKLPMAVLLYFHSGRYLFYFFRALCLCLIRLLSTVIILYFMTIQILTVVRVWLLLSSLILVVLKSVLEQWIHATQTHTEGELYVLTSWGAISSSLPAPSPRVLPGQVAWEPPHHQKNQQQQECNTKTAPPPLPCVYVRLAGLTRASPGWRSPRRADMRLCSTGTYRGPRNWGQY